jgi:hypothetical protein
MRLPSIVIFLSLLFLRELGRVVVQAGALSSSTRVTRLPKLVTADWSAC